MSKDLAVKVLDPLQKQQELLAALKLELQSQLEALKTQELILMSQEALPGLQPQDNIFLDLPELQQHNQGQGLDTVSQIQLEDLFTFHTSAEDEEFLQQFQSDALDVHDPPQPS
jgi:hypothetical protein